MENSNDKFEVFISYRRNTGAQYARVLYYALKSIGIKAFFDYSSIRHGKFNDAIFDAIDQSDCLILLLTPKALEACANNEQDWVRTEVEYAIKHKKTIIPVCPTNKSGVSSLPNVLPPIMEEELRNLQISRLDTGELFTESLYTIISNRFPKRLIEKHDGIRKEIYSELSGQEVTTPKECPIVPQRDINENTSFRLNLMDAIDCFKSAIFDHLVKDFLKDLNENGIIQAIRQNEAFRQLSGLLNQSKLYISEEEYDKIMDFCDTHLAATYNDFFAFIRKYKEENKNTTIEELLHFISSKMTDKFIEDYNTIRMFLVNQPEE